MSELNSLIQMINKGSDLGFQMESDYNDFSTSIATPDLMSSEFFDSILSLEKTSMDENFTMDLGNLVDEGSVTYDDIQCGLSTYSDSGLSSEPHELNTDQILSDEELFSVCSMLEQTVPGTVSTGIDKNLEMKIEPNSMHEEENMDDIAFSTANDTSPEPKMLTNSTPSNTFKKWAKDIEDVANTVAIVTPMKQTVQQSKPKYINIVKPNQKSKQVLKIQAVGGSQRSLLLPINIKDLKTIKIINTNNMKAEDVKITNPQNRVNIESVQLKKVNMSDVPVKKISMQTKRIPIPDGIQAKKTNTTEKVIIQAKSPEPEEVYSPSTMKQMNRRASTDGETEEDRYPMLMLTPEEKRLLCKDGIQLPLRYPLSKTQERELKRIRRKIRNKISAQDSRKRKKEYVDGLEERVKQCSEENRSLMKKIKLLQTQNNKLSTQLSKLQALIFKSGTSRAHPATCLMIVVLSVMLVSLPNLRNLSSDKELNSLQQFVARRALLFDQQATNDDINMDDLITFPSKEKKEDTILPEVTKPLEDPDLSNILNSTKKRFGELFVKIGESIMSKLQPAGLGNPVNEHVPFKEKSCVTAGDPPEYDGKATRKRTIEFEIDDSWPPEKKNATAAKVMHRLL